MNKIICSSDIESAARQQIELSPKHSFFTIPVIIALSKNSEHWFSSKELADATGLKIGSIQSPKITLLLRRMGWIDFKTEKIKSNNQLFMRFKNSRFSLVQNDSFDGMNSELIYYCLKEYINYHKSEGRKVAISPLIVLAMTGIYLRKIYDPVDLSDFIKSHLSAEMSYARHYHELADAGLCFIKSESGSYSRIILPTITLSDIKK